MIEIKYNIDFKRILKEFETQKLTETLNKGVSPQVAQSSYGYIITGKVKPELSDNNPRKIKRKNAIPLWDSRKLANSLQGTAKGITGISYAKEHRQEIEPDVAYIWKGLKVPKREFITAAIPSEKANTKKIYKEFEKKFIKLLKSRLRKR